MKLSTNESQVSTFLDPNESGPGWYLADIRGKSRDKCLEYIVVRTLDRPVKRVSCVCLPYLSLIQVELYIVSILHFVIDLMLISESLDVRFERQLVLKGRSVTSS